MRSEVFYINEKSTDTNWDRTSDLPICSTAVNVFLARNFLQQKNCLQQKKISPITGPRYPEGSRKLRFPDYVTTAQDGGKIVSLRHRPLFTPRKYSWYSFLLEAELTPGP